MNIGTYLRLSLLSQQKWNTINRCQIHAFAILHL